MEEKYGAPEEVSLTAEMGDREFQMLIGSMKHARAHDVTLFIEMDGRYVVISKPSYPPGVYRTPSGGVRPGESFEAGAVREAYEETGLRIQLNRYVLRANVLFRGPGGEVPWTSHVFTARRVGGELKAVDTREIKEVKLATVEELKTSLNDALLSARSGGLNYRARLTQAALNAISTNGGLPSASQ